MSSIRPSLTLMNIFIRSPQTGLPTSPTPLASGIEPTLRGLLKCSITRSLYIASSTLFSCGRQRGHCPQPVHNAGEHREHIVHILVGVIGAEGEPEAAVGELSGEADGEQDMGRVEGG